MLKIAFDFPLDWNLSKNKKFIGRTKKVLSKDYREIRDSLEWFVRFKTKDLKFDKKKIWVIIKVTKKNNVGDCVNLIEGVCDAIKKAINIDDRYFSVICDWLIGEKDNINIRILQNDMG